MHILDLFVTICSNFQLNLSFVGIDMGCGGANNTTSILPGVSSSNYAASAASAILKNGSSMPMNATMEAVIRDSDSVVSDQSVSTLPNYDAGTSNNQTVNSAATGQDDMICVLDFLSSFPDVSCLVFFLYFSIFDIDQKLYIRRSVLGNFIYSPTSQRRLQKVNFFHTVFNLVT